MKILFVGDIVGEPGRRAVRRLLPRFREAQGVDLVIANAENAAGGNGLTSNTAAEVFGAGVDVITMGDHLWDQKEIVRLLEDEPRIVRPANYPKGTPGTGGMIFEQVGKSPVGVINIQGRTFMPPLDNPFLAIEEEIRRLQGETRIMVVDFHAEATSEKIAMARMLDGRVSAVLGTHTHCQTADERVLPNGTAFLCDAGFTGPHESILGREIEPVIQRFRTLLPQRFPVAREDIRLQGALIDIDDATGLARQIERVSLSLSSQEGA